MEEAILIPRPGAKFGRYPERLHQHEPWSFYPAEMMRAKLLAVETPSRAKQRRFIKDVRDKRALIDGSGSQFIAVNARRLRGKLAVDGFTTERVAEAFSLIEACMQMQLGITLHDTQLLAAWLMLDRRLIEMATGEGKTLAVALTAATGALAGIPVHVITANDYLVERDAAYLRPIFQALGLTVGTVTASTTAALRRDAYACDITYCTAKELVFDYLRDRLARSDIDTISYGSSTGQYLRGLCMAIIDEADSILIDEARMPLVLANSTPNHEQAAFYRQSFFLAAQLKGDSDYRLDTVNRSVVLTQAGEQRAARLASHIGGVWNAKLRREEMLCLALSAQHLFIKDRHYVVREKKVVIVDEATGRLARGRVWSRGLQQLIELKEGCPLTDPQTTSTQTTYQRFFARYLRLSGVSGTLEEARGELLAIYGLPVARVPLRLKSRRVMLPNRLFMTRQAQWQYVADRIIELRAGNRPILIGTDSVADSEALSLKLKEAGVPHTVLNAHYDEEEAQIVARAGEAGAVTVATNMAGRGTDIALGEGVSELGGLHVIACQNNVSGRIDRQLYGRCARQGDPGSVEHLHSLEQWEISEAISSRLNACADKRGELPSWFAKLAVVSQWTKERSGRQERWFLFFNDRLMGRQLAFAGGQE